MSVATGSMLRDSWLRASSMSPSIQPSSIRVGGRTVAQGADAEDKLVLVLTGGLVIGVGVVGSEGRVVKDHGEGGLKAAEAGRGRELQESLYCMLSLTLMINALLRIQVKGCRRNDSQTQQSDSRSTCFLRCDRAGMLVHQPAH